MTNPANPANPANDLDQQRKRIDEIDRELVGLLSERARCAQRIGQAKASSGSAIFVPHREQEVFNKIASCSHSIFNRLH